MKDQNRLDASIRPYNVFINHRGPDVKETVVSIIYQLLTDKGLSVFLDKREFEPGQEIDDAITHAIRTSSVHIAIFSPRYAESHWCLDELCLILLESDAKIIPVFYDVPPGDLMRLQKGEGKYADALQKLENKVDDEGKFRFDRQRVRGWKEALKKIANVSGFELGSKIFNGDVGELVQSIVARVMEHFRIAKKKPNEALNDTIDDFDYFLSESRKNNKNVRTVGIVGTAGSGKTTLAEEYYYRKLQYFDRSSFLLGVRNASGLQTLQSQLLEDLTRDQVKINNISSGKEILEVRIACLTRQKCLKFLIVIDDVDNREQLQALLLNETLLGPESWVIVTSRDGAIFKLSGIFLHYKIQPMCADDAQKLFCTEAFHQAEPIPGFKDLVATALRKCGGLPLFLKLVGGHLHLYGNNNRGYCERELEIISDIADILKISYAALGEEEKQIFLDIACFFEGMDKNSAIRIWDGLGWRGARAIQKLEYMCLVQIDENNQLKMNASHSNLARELADQQLYNSPDLPCRLWRPSEATNFLGGLLPVPKNTKMRGIIDVTRSKHRRFGRKRFKTYTFTSITIELFDVDGDLPDDIFSNRLTDLVWFRWKNCPRTSIPLFEMNNLRVLELDSGNFTTLCNPSFQLPTELREVRVIECRELLAVSAEIESLKNLEHLELRHCEALISLPDSFAELTNLQHIDFSDCQNLSELPQSFSQLAHLKYLELRNCRNLMIQPELFGKIASLEQLGFENCEKLRQLPTQTTCQRFLHKLNLMGTSIEELPEDIDQLINLQLLYIESPFLTKIPDSLGNVRCLSELVLVNCTQLINHPEFEHLGLSYPTDVQENSGHNTLYVYGSQISDPNVRAFVDDIQFQEGQGVETNGWRNCATGMHQMSLSA